MKFSDLELGISFKKCSECEYKRDTSLRDDLLVTAGSRLAYMDCKGLVDIPEGVEGEHQIAKFIAASVDYYLHSLEDYIFDEFIEDVLLSKYRKGELK